MIIFCLNRKFIPILRKFSKRLSFSFLAAIPFQFKNNSESNAFSVLAANSIKFYEFLLREHHFVSQLQFISNSTSLFEDNIIFCLSRTLIPVLKKSERFSFSVLAANSFPFKKNSETFSFSVFAANSKLFYKSILRQYHFLS